MEARIHLAATLWQDGNLDAARWQIAEIQALEPTFRVDAWLAAYPLADAAAVTAAA